VNKNLHKKESAPRDATEVLGLFVWSSMCPQVQLRMLKYHILQDQMSPTVTCSAIQGPAHAFVRIIGMLGLDTDINRTSDQGKSVAIWISDEFRVRVDLCADSKAALVFKLRQWTRQAILRTLQERCTLTPDKARKDMKDISCYVDIEATNSNFSQRKGSHQYAHNLHMTNTLKSIISGSIRLGDRLHATGFIQSDQCTEITCDGRHTTRRVFWKCTRHIKR
jgi:hypothetical protein